MSHPDPMTAAERRGDAAAGRALELGRAQASAELLEKSSFDLADIPQAAFDEMLVRMKRRQERLQQVIATVLVEGAHYGNPKNAFKKDILYKAGAEELRETFRLRCTTLAEKVVADAEFVSVTVTIGLIDYYGRVVGETSANCNTAEKRFRGFESGTPTFTDAREQLDNCMAMAHKRAKGRLTLEVTGASAFFDNEQEMEAGLNSRRDGDGEPWSDAQKEKFKADAKDAGVKTRQDLDRILLKALGSERPVYTSDIPALYAALSDYKAALAGTSGVTKLTSQDPYVAGGTVAAAPGEPPAAVPEASSPAAAAAPTPAAPAADLSIDRELAREDPA